MIRIEILADPSAVAVRAADEVARSAVDAVAHAARFTLAVSGGRTPWAMFSQLGRLDLPWDRIAIYEVDERVAPEGDTDRNLTHLRENLPTRDLAELHPIPVDDPDLEAAARRYASTLPRCFDLIHLGLGADGHTASLVPGDPVLDVMDRDVAVTAPYQGHVRMTLTYPVLDRAARVLWVVTGVEKRAALERLRAGDPSIPGGRVRAADQLIVCDAAAAG